MLSVAFTRVKSFFGNKVLESQLLRRLTLLISVLLVPLPRAP